ncbi:hypothetical protein OWV82_018741 [Melia azedarach]|uniref:Uncharacterized protein n=1 Tax=Melia azedarach TaxID=155640 RepID=A0ACC1XDK9_MELAZ|nr:hypothetical protein OWV82_018741 [Melia azedarach]
MAGKNKLEKSGEGDGVNPKDIESNSGSMVQNLNDVRLQSQAANKCLDHKPALDPKKHPIVPLAKAPVQVQGPPANSSLLKTPINSPLKKWKPHARKFTGKVQISTAHNGNMKRNLEEMEIDSPELKNLKLSNDRGQDSETKAMQEDTTMLQNENSLSLVSSELALILAKTTMAESQPRREP